MVGRMGSGWTAVGWRTVPRRSAGPPAPPPARRREQLLRLGLAPLPPEPRGAAQHELAQDVGFGAADELRPDEAHGVDERDRDEDEREREALAQAPGASGSSRR